MNQHQIKPNRWSCAITALAMALHLPVEDVVVEAGHDGSEIIFPSQEEPMCRKGFHFQELVQIAWRHGYAMTPVELFPCLKTTSGMSTVPVWDVDDQSTWNRFDKIVRTKWGILEGRGRKCHHAVYNHFGEIRDPDGQIYEFSKANCEKQGFYANQFWVFTRFTT